MAELLKNGVLLCAMVSWLAAQVLKTLINWRVRHSLDLRRMFGMGGMPSSHTAFLVSLTMMTAFREGIASTAFAISFAIMAVVIYDALGVRYETGKQGKVINRILREMLVEGKKLTDDKLLELIGHTPLEVFFGAIIGLIVPWFFK